MSTGRLALRLRWSWRDLETRVLQVAAIAAIIALGTGVYAGLSSSSEWRRASYDASFAALAVHDVRVTLAGGTFTAQDALADALAGAPGVVTAETRIVVPTQIDASRAGTTILAAGRLVGVETAGGGPTIDALHVTRGTSTVASQPTALLDAHFADHHGLPDSGRLRLPAGRAIAYDGAALSPEHFMVFSDDGSMLAEASFAIAFASRETVQDLAGRPGEVNDAVVRLEPGVDRRTAAAAIAAHLDEALPGVATTATAIDDDRVYRTLYDDIEGDQRLYDIFAFLILGGAAFAAFNLVGRIVEAQRREIGIGMALGMPPVQLAVRPLLVGFQVAVLGAALGVPVGWAVSALMRSIMLDFFPLPEWHTSFAAGAYLQGLAFGITLPFVASALPVWRAVRVAPVDAIRTGPGSARRRGHAAGLHRLALGSSIALMPFRNVVRAPRRTALTLLAIAAAIATLVGVIGLVDSFLATIDRGERAVLGDAPDRLNVELTGFALRDGPELAAVAGADGVGVAEPALRIGGTLLGPGDDRTGDDRTGDIDVLLRVVDLDSPTWRPVPAYARRGGAGPGIVVSEKAARDLGVSAGDEVRLRHPFREGLGYRWVTSTVVIAAVHDVPFRLLAYMDLDDATLMALDGIYNSVTVVPAAGATPAQVQRALFETDGVASAQPVRLFATAIRDTVTEFLDILHVIRAAVLLLAVLIAFNATAINVDERAREHATMFAFGVPLRTVLRSITVESVVVGIAGSAAGIVAGVGIVAYVTGVLLPETLPDIAVTARVSPTTAATAAVLGIVAVGVAPLLTVRRLRRMDIPAALRVVE